MFSCVEHDNACAAHQNVTHPSIVRTQKGNQIIDVESLANVLDEAAVCKKCSKKNYELFTSAFFDFCEEEHEEVMQSAVSAPPAQQLEIYAERMNIRLLHKKWCDRYSPISSTKNL